MPETASRPAPDRVFAIVHAMLVVGVAVILIVLGVVRSVVALEPMSDLVPIFRLVALGVLVAGYLVMRVLRAGIPALGSGDSSAWWTEHGRRALMLWVVAEGIAVAGAVLWLVTGDALLLVGVSGVAFALVLMNRPGRLVEG